MHPAGPALDQDNMLHKVGHLVLSLYLFLAYSRLAEQKFPSLHIPGMVFLMLLCFLIVPGVLGSLFSHSIGRYYVALHVLVLLSVPFSVWRGGSVAFLTTSWWRLFLLFPLVLGLTVDFGGLLRLVRTMAIALLVLAVLVARSDMERLGRIYLGLVSRFGDPNFIAMILLAGIPLWCFLVTRPGASLPVRAGAAICILPLLFVLVKTGSRGGFVAAIIVILYAFFRSSLKGKLGLAGLSMALIGFSLIAIPGHLRDRYVTLFTHSRTQDARLGTAAFSAKSRTYLLRRSLELTARNPLFGVGANMFMVAENGMSVEEGMRKGNWHVTHNMYTQISSEIGIPALCCFIAVLAGSWRSFSRVEKAASLHFSARAPDIARLAFCLKLSLLSLLGTGFFLSIAYEELFAILPAIAVALEQVARREGLFDPAAANLGLVAMAAPGRPRALRTVAQVGA